MKKVLVLDDDKIQHILFRKKAERMGLELSMLFFESAEEVLDYLVFESADVVVSDLNLGQMDGWEFLEELGKIKFAGKVFLLTGSVSQEDRKKALENSMVGGYFEKPVSEDVLREIFIA